MLIGIAIFGPMIDPTDPLAQNGMPMQPPTADPGNWFGTTYFGEDVFAQFANGLRATFFVGLLGGGLVKTLTHHVAFGMLADLSKPEHLAEMERQGLATIDD